MTGSRHVAPGLLALALMAAGLPAAVQAADVDSPTEDRVLQGPANCRFAALKGWEAFAVQWEGPCAHGRATGSGVLRAYGKAGPTQFFFGRIEAGEPRFGVMEAEGGLGPGEFRHGSLVPTDDRGLMIRAFEEAEKAAKQAAARFEARGNAASARFYRARAASFAEQLSD